MKAFQLQEFSGPDGLKPAEVPDPVPGPGQVLVRLRAVSLNYRDLLMAKGLYNPKIEAPDRPDLRRGRRGCRDRGRGNAVQARRPGDRQFHARLGGRAGRR